MGEEPNAQTGAISNLRNEVPFLWLNPGRASMRDLPDNMILGSNDLKEAQRLWRRAGPLLARLFPELERTQGVIDSDLRPAPSLVRKMFPDLSERLADRFLLKTDHALPVAGSVKARGGVFAVIHFARELALKEGLIASEDEDLGPLAEPKARRVFEQWELTVGSTGNLGLSIGIMGSALGFKVSVHMSVEAKEWKKARLRSRGVKVVEHQSDYTAACREVRAAALETPRMHFIDDENSPELFLGYAAAAGQLKDQLDRRGTPITPDRPLFLYLPCGVGGAPGGVAFGARLVFGDQAHPFFAEPTQAPCFLLGMATGLHEKVSVYDYGLKLKTEADGLAVSRPSRFVGRLMEPLLSGVFTLEDQTLFQSLLFLHETEGLEVEPSAAAGLIGPKLLLGGPGREYIERRLSEKAAHEALHVVWTTGGSLVPPENHEEYRRKARTMVKT